MKVAILSGGGTFGAYEVGCLKAISQHESIQYNGYYGVSIGALNGAFLAQYSDICESVKKLENIWRSLTQLKVYKRRFPFGVCHGLCNTGIYDTTPQIEILATHFDRQRVIESGHTLQVFAVSLQREELRSWNEKDIDITAGIRASAAFPIMFPAVSIDGEQYVDGGVISTTPLRSALIDGAESIDIFLTFNRKDRKLLNNHVSSVFGAGIRILETMINAIMRLDIKLALAYNELAGSPGYEDKRKATIRIFEPRSDLPGGPLDFDSAQIASLIDTGYEDTLTILSRSK